MFDRHLDAPLIHRVYRGLQQSKNIRVTRCGSVWMAITDMASLNGSR